MDIQIHRLVEAILFASADPLSIDALLTRLPENADVGAALMALQGEYADRGIHLVEVDGCWAFRTASDLAEALSIERIHEKTLSNAALETLAIIAYHQPITRTEIENIRGVSTNKGTLDTLIDAGWVRPGRRRETLGRPLTWQTTPAFLDHFSLNAVMDLPGLDDLQVSGLLDARPAIDALDHDDLFTQAPENNTPDKDLSQTRQEVLEKNREDAHE